MFKWLFRNVLGRIFVWSRYMRIYSVMIVNIKNLFAERYHFFIVNLYSCFIHLYKISFSSFLVNWRTLMPTGQARSQAPQSVQRPAQW